LQLLICGQLINVTNRPDADKDRWICAARIRGQIAGTKSNALMIATEHNSVRALQPRENGRFFRIA
jgi:hypothetical protein